MSRDDLDSAAELFKTLGSGIRVGLIAALAQRPQTVGELAESLEVSQPLTSQHLRVLRSAHMVRAHREGREVVYEVTDDHVSHIVTDAITHIQEEK
jgi:ArsR family transcriptional regulator, zinc-responsive transcriptional repressor